MTNKEAIFELIKYRSQLEEDFTINAEPFDMAIEALEENKSLAKSLNDAAESICKLQKNGWIPCSEKLPSNDDFVIITILDEHGDTKYRYSSFGWYLNVAKCWIVDDELRNDVVAWAPLPEPYKGE